MALRFIRLMNAHVLYLILKKEDTYKNIEEKRGVVK